MHSIAVFTIACISPHAYQYIWMQLCFDILSDVSRVNLLSVLPVLRCHCMAVVCSDGELYSATIADISSRDALIYKKPIRSEQHDSQWLNGRLSLNSSLCCLVCVSLLKFISQVEVSNLDFVINVFIRHMGSTNRQQNTKHKKNYSPSKQTSKQMRINIKSK